MKDLEGTIANAIGGDGGDALSKAITTIATGLEDAKDLGNVVKNALEGLGNEVLNSAKEYVLLSSRYCKEL